MPSPKKSNTRRPRPHLQSKPLQSRPSTSSSPYTYSIPPSANPNAYSKRTPLPLPEGLDIDIEFGYNGFNYDSETVEKLNGGKGFDDPDYVGPKMRVFSSDMPGNCREFLMGFTDNWKVSMGGGRLWGYDDESDDSDGEAGDSRRSGPGGQKKKDVQREEEEKKKEEEKDPSEVPRTIPTNHPNENGDGREIGGKEKPMFAREEYVRMWITCDGELYMARLGNVLTKVQNLFDKLEKRETRFVRAGAAKKKVDDMLEYSVR